MLAIADTHAVIWYLLNDSRLSPKALDWFQTAVEQSQPIGVSAISLVEIVYLTEKRRIPAEVLPLLQYNLQQGDAVLRVVPVSQMVAMLMAQVDRTTVPDMPDRIITATALYHRVPLISRDRKIQASHVETIW